MTSNEKAQTVGILANGSLIGDPGREIEEARTRTIENVMTPFPVEFARSSAKRGGAPTLVPHERGAKVRAQLFVVGASVSDAADRLYRREIDAVGTGKQYEHSDNPGKNKVAVNRLYNFVGIDIVLYTQIYANIDDLSAAHLASLAIASVAGAQEGQDGISYLWIAMTNGIETPLTAAYAEAIKQRLGVVDLPGAVAAARESVAALRKDPRG